MRIIADSGATRARWLIKPKRGKPFLVETPGINPYFQDSADIEQELRLAFERTSPPIELWEVEEVIFYGAGCSQPDLCNRVINAFQLLFPRAKTIVHHDILGAARATCTDKPGIAVILGTGSNACYYDGREIVATHGGHGFILSDEGSGAYLGRRLLALWLDGELPAPLQERFTQFIGMSRAEIVYKVYANKHASRFLASLALFVRDNLEHEFIRSFLLDSFRLFVERHVKPLQEKAGRKLPVHASGSIAYHFQDFLKQALQEAGYTAGTIVPNPLEGLARYHWKTNVSLH